MRSGEPIFFAESVPSSRSVTNERGAALATPQRRRAARAKATVMIRIASRYIGGSLRARCVVAARGRRGALRSTRDALIRDDGHVRIEKIAPIGAPQDRLQPGASQSAHEHPEPVRA